MSDSLDFGDPRPLPKGVSGVKPPSPVCSHEFSHLETVRWTDSGGGYNTHYFRIDRFYCKKCLVRRDDKKDGWHREPPDWYRSNDTPEGAT